jgi:hypothetical protein
VGQFVGGLAFKVDAAGNLHMGIAKVYMSAPVFEAEISARASFLTSHDVIVCTDLIHGQAGARQLQGHRCSHRALLLESQKYVSRISLSVWLSDSLTIRFRLIGKFIQSVMLSSTQGGSHPIVESEYRQ